MTKTILILAIVAAFMIGTSMSFVLSDYEAEATDPKPPKPPKEPKEPKEVIVANTEPIPVTASSSSHPAVQFEVSDVQISQCDALNTSGFGVRTDLDGIILYGGSIGGTIHRVVVTEDAFELEGIYTSINQGCIDDLRNFPALFSITGDCGLDSTVTVRTEGGVDASFTTNVACIP